MNAPGAGQTRLVNRRRNGNGRSPFRRSRHGYRPQEARHLPFQAQRGCPQRLRGLRRPREGAFRSGCGGLLPRRLYRRGARRGVPQDHRGVHIEFARVLHASSPGAAFSFLSGSRADPTGRSRISFARYKGEAEKSLLATGFPRVYIFRPAYVYPVEPRKEPNFS